MATKTEKRPKAKPTWSDVKGKLTEFDRAGLIQLVSDLYAANKDNRAFLHARFGLGVNPLESFKKRIEAALAPNVYSRTPGKISITAAKQAMSEYTKAVGDPLGVLELRLFWCETAVAFSVEFGMDDAGYFDALVRQYRDACLLLPTLNEPRLTEIIERLETIRDDANVGYGVGDDMNHFLAEALDKLPDTPVEARVPIHGDD